MMESQQASKTNELLAVILPIPKPLPSDLPRPLPRIAGFPAKTTLEDSTYDRRTFDHVNFEVQNFVILPNPEITLKEHQLWAFHELNQNRKHFGEAWVQDKHHLCNTLMNVDANYGLYSSYYEGADGPVPDLQEAIAAAHAGYFTTDHRAGHYDELSEDKKETPCKSKAVRRLFLSAHIRQIIYLYLFFADSKNVKALLPLASTCRFLRAEVISFQRANFGFAFRHPLILKRFLRYVEPGSVLLKHKKNMLTFGCLLIDLRHHLTSCPTNSMIFDVNTENGENKDKSKRFHNRILDNINTNIMQLPASRNKADPPDTNHREAALHFGLTRRQLVRHHGVSNARYGIRKPKLTDWAKPVMQLLKSWKVQRLVIRCDLGGRDNVFSHLKLVECLLGFTRKKHTTVVFENVGGWNWNALEYRYIIPKDHSEDADALGKDGYGHKDTSKKPEEFWAGAEQASRVDSSRAGERDEGRNKEGRGEGGEVEEECRPD